MSKLQTRLRSSEPDRRLTPPGMHRYSSEIGAGLDVSYPLIRFNPALASSRSKRAGSHSPPIQSFMSA